MEDTTYHWAPNNTVDSDPAPKPSKGKKLGRTLLIAARRQRAGSQRHRRWKSERGERYRRRRSRRCQPGKPEPCSARDRSWFRP